MLNNESIELLKRQNAFDFLRYLLTLSIFISHFYVLNDIERPWWCISGLIRVKAFFIISGFLVFYTYIKKPQLSLYIKKRVRRILPPYILVIVLCVLTCSLVSNLHPYQYFTSTDTYKYLLSNLSFMNFLHPTLPGVFQDNPIHAVNGSLWTMKVEIMFYVSVPIVFYCMRKVNKLYVIITVFLFAYLYDALFYELFQQTRNEIFLLIRKQIGSQFMYFYSGTFILLYFNYFIKYLKYLLPLSMLIYGLSYTDNFIFLKLEPIAFAAIIIGSAYLLKYFFFLRKYENISYGMYLFHYPIIQIFIHYNITEYNFYLSFFGSLAITTLISIVSWKYLEKPIIDSKRFKRIPLFSIKKKEWV